ncbi:MAG: hypothetical protein K0R62_6285 [Nonomuraea muscovyensis]|jgi:hypothetical protein|nr:hypothetical protein [Nonomuraea muscovyensis]
MALDGELLKALEEAAEQERGLRRRGKTLKTADPVAKMAVKAGTRTGTDAGGYDCGAVSG